MNLLERFTNVLRPKPDGAMTPAEEAAALKNAEVLLGELTDDERAMLVAIKDQLTARPLDNQRLFWDQVAKMCLERRLKKDGQS